jgi:hypothetical protein
MSIKDKNVGLFNLTQETHCETNFKRMHVPNAIKDTNL